MSQSSVEPQPVVLLSTSTAARTDGLLRQDVLTGRNYAQALVAAGTLPLMVPTTDVGLVDAYLEHADALLLTGGCDVDPARFGAQPDRDLGTVDAERDAFEFALYRAFRRAEKPVLGICRGIQLINVAEGGTLHQHVPSVSGSLQHDQHDLSGVPLHAVTLEPGSLLAGAYGTMAIRANSYHHQAVDRPGTGLRVTARTADGMIEALEGEAVGLVVGVQWHPEMSWQAFPEHHAPFRLFADAARAHRARDVGRRGSGRVPSPTGAGTV